MGCFLLKDKTFYITEPEKLNDSLLNSENAIVTKNHLYWKVTTIKKGESLDPNTHIFVKDGEKVQDYCNFCTDRLVSITKGCQDCFFNPNVSFDEVNVDSFATSLKKIGYYEVDEKIFENEIENLRLNTKKESH